jgi:hypothetical protein
MKINQLIAEANIAARIKDPKLMKLVSIAMKHDSTLPRHKVAALGVRPTDEQTMKLWSDLLDLALSRTKYGDVSQDGKFDEWLTRLYANGQIDYEDLTGEAGDALGAWKALSIRGRLKVQHQDFNKFRSLQQIQAIVQDREYRDELRRIQDDAVIQKHKKESKQLVILNDEKYQVIIPFNYGSCYTFNNAAGFQASFCTGSSGGLQWFDNYANRGPVISVIDKENFDSVDGKWQIHAPTNQINNGNQRNNGDQRFASLFPGLMKKIVAGVEANAEKIMQGSQGIAPPNGYNIERAVNELKTKFPLSYASEEPSPPEAPASA